MLVLSETELVQRWDGCDLSVPVVSVVCCTFNHVRYIDLALSGFFSQVTNFTFEVVIQNDASSDGTETLISEWEEKYPVLLRAFHHKENQLKQGLKPGPLAIKRARGKYIAMCDGDDFWLDPFKLQKQYDALEKFSSVDICFHPANEYRNQKFHSIINKYYREEKVIPLTKVIEGRGGYMPTSSLMIRKAAIYPFPDWFLDHAPVGDIFLQALGSMRGGALFLPDAMSVYRRYTEGSVTQTGRSGILPSKVLIDKARNYLYCYNQLRSQESSPSIELACCRQLIEVLGHSIRLGDRFSAKEIAYLIRANFGHVLTIQLKFVIWSVVFQPLFLFARGVLKLRDRAG